MDHIYFSYKDPEFPDTEDILTWDLKDEYRYTYISFKKKLIENLPSTRKQLIEDIEKYMFDKNKTSELYIYYLNKDKTDFKSENGVITCKFNDELSNKDCKNIIENIKKELPEDFKQKYQESQDYWYEIKIIDYGPYEKSVYACMKKF